MVILGIEERVLGKGGNETDESYLREMVKSESQVWEQSEAGNKS